MWPQRDLLGGAFRRRWTPIVIGLLAAMSVDYAQAAHPLQRREQIRRPVAIVPIAGGTQLAVLNRRSGTVSRIDPRSRQVLDEYAVADRIAAGCLLAEGQLAVLDDQTQEFIVLTLESAEPQVVARQAVAATPVNATLSPGGLSCIVASTWARRLTVFSRSPSAADRWQVAHTLDLPFAPRQLRFIDEQRLWVADAFGGWLALVDIGLPAVIRSRELHATHNITGLELGNDRSKVYLTHQMLKDDQATTQPNVHWGDVMSNVVRELNLDWFLSSAPEQTTAADLYYLGYPDRAAGDPAGILITESARFVVGFGGVDQVAVSDRGLNHFQRLDVGRRPIAMWLDAKHNELFVANHFDDSISVIDLARTRVVATISLGPSAAPNFADQGEQLFYDARLSSDGWYSCHSCHSDGHTNGQRSDTFGDGYRGSPKQVPSLLGSAETGPWAWNGQMPMLEAQIRKSLETTMQGEALEPAQIQSLAAYLMSLSPPPSMQEARGEHDLEGVGRGRVIFDQLGCADCHQPPRYTSSEVYDVGLEDADGQRKFNPPSLLGVGHRRRLLHDGRAEDLRHALQVHPFGHPLELENGHWDDLRAFLLSL